MPVGLGGVHGPAPPSEPKSQHLKRLNSLASPNVAKPTAYETRGASGLMLMTSGCVVIQARFRSIGPATSNQVNRTQRKESERLWRRCAVLSPTWRKIAGSRYGLANDLLVYPRHRLHGASAYSQTTPQPVPASDEGPAVYVVRVISVSSTQRDAFVACLAQNDLPFWRGLKEKGLLAKVSVFETTSVTSSKPGVPAWNFVIVQAVEKTKGCENAAGAEVRRIETLRTTPNCNYARATAANDLKARESKVEFYIAVKDAPETLDRFRKFMSLYECLRANSLIRDGWWLRAVALETVNVLFELAVH
jgi:hypothetical protein